MIPVGHLQRQSTDPHISCSRKVAPMENEQAELKPVSVTFTKRSLAGGFWAVH